MCRFKRSVSCFNEPAPGGRYYSTGALSIVGHGGYSWFSTVSATDGMSLNFGMTWLNPSNMNNRAYGFQLRCLSE